MQVQPQALVHLHPNRLLGRLGKRRGINREPVFGWRKAVEFVISGRAGLERAGKRTGGIFQGYAGAGDGFP
jgi:hypothetical protein